MTSEKFILSELSPIPRGWRRRLSVSPAASQEDAKGSEVSRARRGGRFVKAESPQGKDFHRLRGELVTGTNFSEFSWQRWLTGEQ